MGTASKERVRNNTETLWVQKERGTRGHEGDGKLMRLTEPERPFPLPSYSSVTVPPGWHS
jgi:hypothetical protein